MAEWLFDGLAHRWCMLDRSWLVVGMAVGDLLIWLSFWGFAGLALWLLRRRPDLPVPGVVRTVMWVYLTCGLTHLLDAVGLWTPIWPIAMAAKAITAGFAWYGFLGLAHLVTTRADWILSSQLDFSLRLRVCEEEKLVLAEEKAALRQQLAHARVDIERLRAREDDHGESG